MKNIVANKKYNGDVYCSEEFTQDMAREKNEFEKIDASPIEKCEAIRSIWANGNRTELLMSSPRKWYSEIRLELEKIRAI